LNCRFKKVKREDEGIKRMIWQDYAIAVIVYMFVAVTIPQVIDVIRGKTSLNLLMAGPTFLGNYGLAYVFLTLGLLLSVISAFLIATLWLLIFIFSWRNKRHLDIKDL
jgi:hypothetical protein